MLWMLLFSAVSTIVQCPPDYCKCSSFEFLLILLTRMMLASLLHAGFFTVVDTDSSDIDPVDIHDVPIVPAAATVVPDVNGV